MQTGVKFALLCLQTKSNLSQMRFLSHWLFFIGKNGLSGGFFAHKSKVVPQFSCTAMRRATTKKGEKFTVPACTCFASFDGNENAKSVSNLKQSKTFSSFPFAFTCKRRSFQTREIPGLASNQETLENLTQGYLNTSNNINFRFFVKLGDFCFIMILETAAAKFYFVAGFVATATILRPYICGRIAHTAQTALHPTDQQSLTRPSPSSLLTVYLCSTKRCRFMEHTSNFQFPSDTIPPSHSTIKPLLSI
jgi:hypothetical protein